MKIPACPPKPRQRLARTLLNIFLGLLLLHLTSLPVLANCNPLTEVDTAIGCLPVTIEGAKGPLFCAALNIVGLLALILFIAGGYQVMAAGDDPKAFQEGKEKMTGAILGFLAFLLFGWIIRSILGIEILALPIVCN